MQASVTNEPTTKTRGKANELTRTTWRADKEPKSSTRREGNSHQPVQLGEKLMYQQVQLGEKFMDQQGQLEEKVMDQPVQHGE